MIKTTHFLIAINALIYAAMLATAGRGELMQFSSETLLRFGANFAPLERMDGQWYRLATSVFIHITPIHLLMNMMALNQAGVMLEEYHGRVRYVGLYLVSGLAGSVASIAWNWNHPVVSAGASGAISGLIGGGIVAAQLIGTQQARVLRDAMLRWGVIVLVYGWIAKADNAAHAGGMVAGALIAWIYGRRAAVTRDRGPGLDVALILAFVGVGFGMAAQHAKEVQLPGAMINEGVARARAQKHAEAIELYRRAIRLDPDEPIAHFDLALSLLQLGQEAEAQVELERAIALDPKNDNARELLRTLHEAKREVGDRDDEDAAAK